MKKKILFALVLLTAAAAVLLAACGYAKRAAGIPRLQPQRVQPTQHKAKRPKRPRRKKAENLTRNMSKHTMYMPSEERL